MDKFPFPDQIGARGELKRDRLYNKIDPALRAGISDTAWNMGVKVMEQILTRQHNLDIYHLCKERGLNIKHASGDQVAGGRRYFGECNTGAKEIILYDGSVTLWAAANRLSKELGEEMILSHELFHYLESTEIGPASKLYQAARFKIGRWEAGRCGICALSEIAAHGFSRAYYDYKVLKAGE